MNTRKTFATLAVLTACSLGGEAFAQGTMTLRDPLIPGVQSTAPGLPAVDGTPPPVGNGPTPMGVTPGQAGPPTLEPWIPTVPANTAGISMSGIGLPVSPAVLAPPGVLGPSLTGIVPSAPSTPGAAPGSLTAPTGYSNPARDVLVNQGGGLPGTGGYNGSINRVRRGGQQTHQFEERGRHSVVGGGGNSQDIITQFGPLAGMGLPLGVPTGNGYNNGPAGSNTGFRNSSLDLGGGQRLLIGGQKISTGSSIQDYGNSATRNNRIPALHAHKSTDLGQGRHDQPFYSSKTTSFATPYQQFSPANVTSQKTGQLLPPSAVMTNN